MILVGDDFNAHHMLWGNSRSDTRGEALLEVVELIQFSTLSDGPVTFTRAGVSVFST